MIRSQRSTVQEMRSKPACLAHCAYWEGSICLLFVLALTRTGMGGAMILTPIFRP